jgi:hypothetical protein
MSTKLDFPAELADALAGEADKAAGSGPAETQAAGSAAPAAAAGAPAGPVGTQQPSGSPDAPILPPKAWQEMAERRKRQLSERDSEINRLRAERDQLAAFRQGTEAELVPTLTRTFQEKQLIEQQLAVERFEREKAVEQNRRLKAEHQIEKDPDISDWEREAKRRWEDEARTRKLDYAIQQIQRQPAARVAAPNGGDDANTRAAVAHFQDEIERLKGENPIIARGLDRHAQSVLNAWWQSGGNRSVSSCAQDVLHDLRERLSLELEVKRAKGANLPAVTGPGGMPAPAAGQNTLLRRPTSTGPVQNPDGTYRTLDQVVNEKLIAMRTQATR